jgi:hypothetical protein
MKDLTKTRSEEVAQFSVMFRTKTLKDSPFHQFEVPRTFHEHNQRGLHQVVSYLMQTYGSIAL